MLRISQREEEVLRALGQFQYLTVSQLLRLQVSSSKSSLYPLLRKLSESARPCIGKIHYTGSPTRGRLESIYYLSAYGAKQLLALGLTDVQIKRPLRRSVSFASDYFHRIWTVDFFIELALFARQRGYSLQDFHYYFQQRTGSNRHNKGGKSLSDTRLDIQTQGVGYIVPDGVFIVSRSPEKPFFGLFEQHNGSDTGKLLRQLEGHRVALTEGTPSLKYEVRHAGEYVGSRVFVCFERDGCMQAALHRLAKDERFHPFAEYFAFSTSENLKKEGFERAWYSMYGTILKIT